MFYIFGLVLFVCVRFGPVQTNQVRVQSSVGTVDSATPPRVQPIKGVGWPRVWGVQNFSLKTIVCVLLVKHPSGDGDAAYQFVIKIAARVLVFIKDYQAQV